MARDRLDERISQISQRLLTDDAKTYAQDLAEYSKLLGDKQKAEEQSAAAIQAIENRTAVTQQKTWQTMFRSIQSGMDQMIRGILQGTQSIGQAFARLGGDLLVIMTQALAKILLKHIAHWVAVHIIEHSAMLQSITTAITGSAAKNAVIATTNTTNIVSNAASGAAAAFASVIEALPFPENVMVAPEVAASTFAQIVSFTPVASAAGGWDVPGSISPGGALTLIHPNEMVLPPSIANAIRSGGGGPGGGGDVHVHYSPTIHAIDARGMREALREHGDTLRDIYRQQQREFRI